MPANLRDSVGEVDLEHSIGLEHGPHFGGQSLGASCYRHICLSDPGFRKVYVRVCIRVYTLMSCQDRGMYMHRFMNLSALFTPESSWNNAWMLNKSLTK